jgi:serine protease Do
MEDILLFDAVERYLNNEMNANEKAYFEQLRNTNPEIDQLVVEHSMFIHQMDSYATTRAFKHQLSDLHNKLVMEGDISEGEVTKGGKVIQIWRKYRRVTAIAASIACITALFISSLINYYIPTSNKKELRELDRKIAQVAKTVNNQGIQINQIKASKAPKGETLSLGGTSFMLDGKGYLVTNAHVVRGASTILVQNTKGQDFRAIVVKLDDQKDIAILKIQDEDYKAVGPLPYSIRKSTTNKGAQLYTLGYPKDEIVYNEGYLSSENGFNGDTLSVQINLSANPGNSGGPVLNKYGEIIGILSTSQTQAEGVVFAIKSKNIFQALEELKKSDTSFSKVKLPSASSLKGMDREQQIKQVEDYVYLVKSFTAK